jgi:hypothetical protein
MHVRWVKVSCAKKYGVGGVPFFDDGKYPIFSGVSPLQTV